MRDMAKGSAALASNAISSDDMPFSRLGSSKLVSVLAWHLIRPPSYFKGSGENRGTGLKELSGRLRSAKVIFLEVFLDVKWVLWLKNETDRAWKALGMDSVKTIRTIAQLRD